LQVCHQVSSFRHYVRPLFIEQELLDPIGMKEVVKSEMAKHDEHGIVAILAVLCRASPIRIRKASETPYERYSITNIRRQRSLEFQLQEGVVRILGPGIVR